MKKKTKWLSLLCLSPIFMGCVEEFEPENIIDVLEGLLVVDARISDQNIQQTIFLSLTFSFSEAQPAPERGAQVGISDDVGATIHFSETSPGNYSTDGSITLQHDRKYTLEIVSPGPDWRVSRKVQRYNLPIAQT